MLKTVSSITNAIGALNYKGAWNANTNSPALASGVGTKGDYYVVGTAGTTALDGISNWGIGDWVVFNGSVWQRVEGGADLNGVNLSVSGSTTLSGLTAGGVAYLNNSKVVTAGTAFNFNGNTLGLGVTPSGWPSQGDGYYVAQYGNAALYGIGIRFMRLTINGYVDASGVNRYISNEYSTRYQQADGIHTWSSAPYGTAGNQITYTDTMSVNESGNLTISGSTATKATGTAWSNPSDQRLKDNIRDYQKGVSELLQIRVREWEYNGKGGTVAGTKGLGVVADEAMQVLPDTVSNYEAKLNEDDTEKTEIKAFDATEITWLLVKSVQQQQAEIESLKAQIAELKGV